MAAERTLGLRSAVALVVANMVGAGVFTTSGYALADLGSRAAVLWAWAAGGVLAALGALSYGALAARFPNSGGEYEFLRLGLHPVAGVAAGFVSLFAGFSAPIAFAATALEVYAWPLLGGGEPPLRPWLGSAVIVGAAVVHGRGVVLGARIQDAVVAVKLLLIVGLIVAGAWLLGRDGVPAGGPPLRELRPSAFALTSLWVFLAYSGWNAAVYVGGEVVEPRRSLPRALLTGTAVVTVLYLGLNAVFLLAVPPARLAGQEEVALLAAEQLLGGSGRTLTGVIVVLALATSVSAMMMAGPRVYERMAEDGALPPWFARRGPTPTRALLLQSVLALSMLWVSTLAQLMSYIGWTLSVSAALTVVGLIRVRRREGAAAVPCPGYPLVPVLFVLGVLWMAAAGARLAPVESALGLATVVFGAVLHRFVRGAA